jgi:hypothetical protein
MKKPTRAIWLDAGVGFALGFWLCLVGIAFWPVESDHEIRHYEDDGNTKGKSTYQEMPKTWGEWRAAVWERTGEDPIALYTLVLMVFTGILGGATFLLWRDTRRLATGAEETAERQLRAYVIVDACRAVAIEDGSPGESHTPITVPKRVVAIVEYKNSGQTPAYQVRVDAEAEIMDWPLDEKRLDFHPTNAGSKTILGRDHEREIRVDELSASRVSMATYAALRDGQKAFVVWGVITYVDIFGESRRTTFRHFTGGSLSLHGTGMGAHDQGNEAT